MPDPAPPLDRLPEQATDHLPMQARVSALAPGNPGRGTVSEASSTLAAATVPATLDASKFTTVWSEGFDIGFGRMDERWGDVTLSGGAAVLKSSAATGWAAAGMMQKPTGAAAGQGYGLYTIQAKTDPSEGPGPFACLWPSSNVWPGPELDLFEKASQWNYDGYSAVHWKGSDASGQPIDEYQLYQFQQWDMSQWHTYAMDWAADHISLYIDGALVWTTTEHVPLDYAHGGQNESFGAGMQPAWAAAQQNGTTNVLYVDSMSYAAPAASSPPPPPTTTPGKVVTGDKGNNTLTGTTGNDTITGGRGKDTMTGLAGEDDFVFSAGDGFDRIKDFQTGVDDLVFKGLTAAQVTWKEATYSGVSGVDVTYGGGTANHVFLEGVPLRSFSSADMVFA